MKVLHLMKTSDGGGWALLEMQELVKKGIEIHVALPSGGRHISEYQEAGIIIHYINFSLKKYFSCAKLLKKIVNEVKPSIIQSHFLVTTIIMRLALRKYSIPRIFKVPGPLHLENYFFRNLDIFLSQKCDYWIGSCKWTCERYKKSGVLDKKIFMCYYGSFIPPKYSKGKLKKELNLDSNKILIGMIAYMYKPKKYLGQKRGLKGHEDFIDAISIISKDYPNIIGVCVGGAWGQNNNYEKKVINYAKNKTKNVIFLGNRSDVQELYQDFFCVVHPSHTENIGSAGESSLLGVPTIATNIGGFPDIIIPNETGLLAKVKNPKSIALNIKKMILNKQKTQLMANKAQKLAQHLFNINKTSNDMIAIYQDILSQNV